MLIVAGPSGSGKTTLGRALAAHLGWAFEDADDHHAPEAKAKMAEGAGLTDADRVPWLDRLARLIRDRASGGAPTVLACSALTAAYRQRLLTPGAALIWLDVPREVLRQRLEARAGHFAGAALLPSQLATAEPPVAGALVLDGSQPLAESVAEVLEMDGLYLGVRP